MAKARTQSKYQQCQLQSPTPALHRSNFEHILCNMSDGTPRNTSKHLLAGHVRRKGKRIVDISSARAAAESAETTNRLGKADSHSGTTITLCSLARGHIPW